MKKRKDRISTRILLAILTVICVAAIALSVTDMINIAPVRRAVSLVVVPFQKGINSIGTWVTQQVASFGDVQELSDKVESLQEKLSLLEEENARLSLEQEELEMFRQLYQTDNDYQNYEKVAATVISKDPGNWYSTFIIDKGSRDGIEPDMNVLGCGGLVGIVTEVGKNWASVRSIMDDSSNVSAMTTTNFDTCIVSGDLTHSDQGLLTFEQMDTENTVLPGERIVTSNISDKYLSGILIGTISEINDDSNNLTKTGTIIPAVDFRKIQTVLVILRLREQPEM